jgi:uncharacterized protein (TIGR02217 family)
MSFLSVQFPTDISYGSSGGPVYNTSIIVIKSGKEKRNINWNYPRIEFDVSYGVRRMKDLEDLISFFHVVQGKGHSFRFKDWSDYKSCKIDTIPTPTDQPIGAGDGETTNFQLYKVYSIGGYSRLARKITKPVLNSVSVAIDGVEQSSGWSIEYSMGTVAFDTAPNVGSAITCGFEFDIEARFDTDTISANFQDYKSGSIEIPVIEVK